MRAIEGYEEDADRCRHIQHFAVGGEAAALLVAIENNDPIAVLIGRQQMAAAGIDGNAARDLTAR